MLRTCTCWAFWSSVLDCCMQTTTSIHSAFMGSFRYHAGSWKLEQILTLVESNVGDSHAWVSWMRVGTIGSFERLETWRIFTFVDQHSMSLEGGRISPSASSSWSKRLLADNQNTPLLCARFCWSLKLEVWNLKIASTRPWHIKSFVQVCVQIKFD